VRSYSLAVPPDDPDGPEPAPSPDDATAGSAGAIVSPGEPGDDVDTLHHEVDELRRQNEALRSSEGTAHSGRGRRRLRTVSSWVLLVLACLLAVVSVLVVFTRNQLLNTDTYVSTVTPLASDPAIQTAVATKVSNQLVERVNIEQRVKSALPARASFLATPITSEVKSATYAITLKLVESDQFQKLWVVANRASHKQLVAVLTGSSNGSVSTSGGRVTIDLSQVELNVKKQLDAKGITVFNKVPAVKGLNFVLFQSDQLTKIQKLVRVLNKVAVLLPILALLLFAAAVALARNRRKGLVRAGAGLALSMGIILVAVSVGRNQYLSSLSPDQSKPANAAVIDTVSAPLQDGVRTIVIIAAVVAVIAVLAGVPAIQRLVARRSGPSWLSAGPFHDFVSAHRRGLQWAVLAVGLFVLVVWNKPTTLVAVIVVLITLALIGLVGLVAGRRGAPSPGTPSLPPG